MHLYAAGKWPEANIRYKKRLYSYSGGRKSVWASIHELLGVVEKPRVMVDSGAFTVWNTGGSIDLEEYIEFIGETKRLFEDRLSALHFITLDVIGDPVKTKRNHERITSKHPDVLPVVTRGATEKDIDWALEHSLGYIAVGGLAVGFAGENNPHLDLTFAKLLRRWKKTGEMVKVHMLGSTNLKKLLKYPTYSSDSTSYVSPGRYGRGPLSGRIPKATVVGKKATNIRDAEIREYLRKYREMEKIHTTVWCGRGICWEE